MQKALHLPIVGPQTITVSILSINYVKTNLKLYGDSRILATPDSDMLSWGLVNLKQVRGGDSSVRK